jgi:DNA-binding NarL/FixJ family response regulator
MKKNVLVVDDHEIVRKGLITFLSGHFSGFRLVEAGTMAETMQCLNQEAFDLLILDLNLPDAHAEKFVREVKLRSNQAIIIVFSMFPAEIMRDTMRALGAHEYLHKAGNLHQLKEVIEQLFIRRPREVHPPISQVQNPFQAISPKEFAVLFALIEGKPNKEIAGVLQISTSTVATYKQRILEKLQIKSTAELVKLAMQFDVFHMS